MKRIIKILILTSILISLGSAFYFFKGRFIKEEKVESNQQVLGLPMKKEINLVSLELDGQIYEIRWYEVADNQRIFLYANSKSLTSREFQKEYECDFVSSAGYYKTDHSPTGLLISEYNEISPFVNSTLSNAVFSVNDFEIPRITSIIPRDRLRLALQVGPLLKENGFKQILKPKNNEEARRMVLGVTGENKAVFMIYYNPNSVYQGPLLKDLPGLVIEFENETGIILADAMNLDGGTATAFLTSDVNLPGASFVGSFFCVR